MAPVSKPVCARPGAVTLESVADRRGETVERALSLDREHHPATAAFGDELRLLL